MYEKILNNIFNSQSIQYFLRKYRHLNIFQMQIVDLIKEIQKLPLNKKFYVVEETLKSIKREELSRQLALAADALHDDYANDKELTIFTSLDFENFYEAK